MLDKFLLWLYGLFGANAAAWILTLVLIAGGGYAGWTANGWRWQAKVSAQDAEHARERETLALAIADARVRAIDAIERGEMLAAEVNAGEAKRIQLARERDDAIRKNTTGRACLDGGVVGLLNAGAGAGFRLPAASGGAFAAAGAAAADSDDGRQMTEDSQNAGARRPVNNLSSVLSPLSSGYATDTDVALWAGYARDQYDNCRGRIDALRRFYEE